jgi:hypothetical protein
MSRIGTALIAAFISMTLFGCAPSQQATQSESLSREMAEFPKMKVGDKWTSVSRLNSRRQGSYSRKGYTEIVAVNPDGSWEEIGFWVDDQKKVKRYYNNKYELEKLQNIGTDEKPKAASEQQQALNFPLSIGKKWSQSMTDTSVSKFKFEYKFEYEVKSLEKVKTKAGTFLSYKIEQYYENTEVKQAGGRWTRLYWYSPEAKRIVKFEPDYKETEDIASMELIEYSPAK